MGVLSAVGASYLAGRQIKSLYLFMFDWDDATAPKRFFLGEGIIVAGGFTWYGSGRLVSISDMEQGVRGEAPKTTFVISGVDDDLVNATVLAADQVYNRPCYAYYLWYVAENPGYVIVGGPLQFWSNTMKALTITTELGKSEIQLETEGPFFKRKRGVHGNLTSVDQQARFPGDKGCDNMPKLVDTTITWPYFGDA